MPGGGGGGGAPVAGGGASGGGGSNVGNVSEGFHNIDELPLGKDLQISYGRKGKKKKSGGGKLAKLMNRGPKAPHTTKPGE